MANECKLCCFLGMTSLDKVSLSVSLSESDENVNAHYEIHKRQLRFIEESDFLDSVLPEKDENDLPRKKPFKSPFSDTCLELVQKYGTGSEIECTQCKRRLKAKESNMGSSTFIMLNHACVHLKKDFFACRHCDLKFISKGAVIGHLTRAHALSRSNMNYIDTTNDHQSEILDVIKICFGKTSRSLPPLGKGRARNQKQQSNPLLKLGHNLLEKYQQGCRIQCSMCSSSSAYDFSTGLAVSYMVDHARWHMEKPVFTCNLCQSLYFTRVSFMSHLKSAHGLNMNKQHYVDGSCHFYDQIMKIMEECFGKTTSDNPLLSHDQKSLSRAKINIKHRPGFSTLFIERRFRCIELGRKYQSQGKVQCRICQQKCRIVFEKCFQAPILLQHALCHSNKLVYSCRHCSHTSVTRKSISLHIKSSHNGCRVNEFQDHTDDFHAEIMDMLTKCFDWDLETNNPDTDTHKNVSQKRIARVISLTRGNNLLATRQLHVYELIAKFATTDRVTCRICSKDTKIKTNKFNMVCGHALQHLDKHFWPYSCKRCHKTFTKKSHIISHLKNVHKIKGNLTKELDDKSDAIHSQCMDIISKCFDWSEVRKLTG